MPDSPRADAIIVLTGGVGRLATGGELLRRGRAPVLMISGVHPSVTDRDIEDQTGLDSADFACCVVLDRIASDTVGNATETARWVAANSYQRLIIVTSDYHLPRSLLEMERAMPGVELIPYPVVTTPPWINPGNARLWLQEYAKYVTVWLGRSFNAAVGRRA
ncbi:YdcF family protein [Maricaulis sp.]|uniref:YdcF family protein n=1 Tax=Maricaulis sp. TaxID=1486257 RepID=UPI00260DC2DC|nr:YdcF family protein [Maricaulis sp.]